MTARNVRPAPRWLPPLTIGSLWLLHTLANWLWLNKNVMTRGWDRVGALINSLFYYDTLSTWSLQSLFKASVQDMLRPPLFGVSMAMMYKFFDVSADVAVMVNTVYWAILLTACYGLGSRLGGWRLGVLSAVLVALIPLVYAMSRYSYFEFSVAALVALTLYLLLASERFEKRGASILLGVSLGLGALLKRTFPIFVVGAGLVVFFQAGLPRKLWRSLRSLSLPRWRDVGLAVGGGLLLSALWYWPNRDLAQTLPADGWMFPLWWALLAVTIYLLLQPPGAVSNFLSSGAVGLSLASLWYLPRADFIQQLLYSGWGVNDPRGRTVDLLAPATYTEYLGSIVYGLSPFFVLLLILSLGLLAVHALVKRRRLLPARWWDSGWLLLVASPLVAHLSLSVSIYKEPRAITPLLPLLGVILAGALLALPWRWPRRALIALAVGFGVVQFFAVSFTETHWLVTETNFARPLLGQRGVFAQGPYLELPDSGLNDPGYYIAGDVLARVEEGRRRQGWEEASLGVLAGSSHVHVGMFFYEHLLHYPHIHVEDPVQVHPLESPYSMAYRYDYVLLLDWRNRGSVLRAAVDLILGEKRALFEQAFELETTYTLPNGSQVYLYRRRMRPPAGVDDSALYDAAQVLRETAGPDDLVIVHPPALLSRFLENDWGTAPIATLDTAGPALERADRVFLVIGPGAEAEPALPGFAPVAEQRFGPVRLLTFEASVP